MTRLHPLHCAVMLALAASFLAAPASAQQVGVLGTPDGAVADAQTLDTMTVRPQYEAQQRAIDKKRDANSIEDVISSDAMGQYPDKNVAESLSRLPGVSVTRDQGEGRFVVIRGLDAGLNSVTVDGMSLGTPEDGSRATPLDLIPSDSTERLTVVKVPTPDMPGDSIGGAIQMESASAFDREGRSLRARLEASHNELSGQTSPKGAFNFSDIYAGGTLGVAAGVSYQDRDYESDNVEVEYDEMDGVPDGELFATEIQQRKYTINRERLGANLNFDWRQSDANHFFLRTLYSKFTDTETRQNNVYGFGDGEVTGAAGGIYTVEDLPADALSRRVRFRTKDENTVAVSAGGDHRLAGGDVLVDYRVGYTRTEERVDDEVEGRFEYDADDLSAVLDQRGRLPKFSISGDGGGYLENDNYEFDKFVFSPKQVDDKEHSAAVNVTFLDEGYSIKAGLLGRWRERRVDVDEVEFTEGPDLNLGALTGKSPRHENANMGQGISSRALRKYLSEFRGEYSADDGDVGANTATSLTEDYVAEEDILAAYLMGTFDIGDLRVVAGARLESTKFHAVGNSVDLDEDGDVAAITQRVANSSYSNLLPGLHLRYDGLEHWVFRGAYTQTIARPAFGDISPRVSINRDDEEVELGNPDLKPYKSQNLDLAAERYIGDAGLVSVGLFHKSIQDYVVQTVSDEDERYPGFDVATAINGDDAKVRGIEVNWQQQLAFLPGGWSGLLVGLSGTWMDTEFSLPSRPGETFQLPMASERVYSAHIGYEKGGVSTRLAAVHRSDYLDTLGDDDRYDIYVAPNTQLDFSLDVALGDRWSVYLEASNLLDEPLELYQGTRSRTLQDEQYGRTFAVGVKVKL